MGINIDLLKSVLTWRALLLESKANLKHFFKEWKLQDQHLEQYQANWQAIALDFLFKPVWVWNEWDVFISSVRTCGCRGGFFFLGWSILFWRVTTFWRTWLRWVINNLLFDWFLGYDGNGIVDFVLCPKMSCSSIRKYQTSSNCRELIFWNIKWKNLPSVS